MNATQFTSMDAARRVLSPLANAASLLSNTDVLQDGTVIVYGVGREFLFEEGLISYTIINGHHRCLDIVGL